MFKILDENEHERARLLRARGWSVSDIADDIALQRELSMAVALRLVDMGEESKIDADDGSNPIQQKIDPERKLAETERACQQAIAERDQARQERDQTLQELKAVQAERDVVAADRDEAAQRLKDGILAGKGRDTTLKVAFVLGHDLKYSPDKNNGAVAHILKVLADNNISPGDDEAFRNLLKRAYDRKAGGFWSMEISS